MGPQAETDKLWLSTHRYAGVGGYLVFTGFMSSYSILMIGLAIGGLSVWCGRVRSWLLLGLSCAPQPSVLQTPATLEFDLPDPR